MGTVHDVVVGAVDLVERVVDPSIVLCKNSKPRKHSINIVHYYVYTKKTYYDASYSNTNGVEDELVVLSGSPMQPATFSLKSHSNCG